MPMLVKLPIFHTLLLGVLGRTCFSHLPPSFQPALGGNGQPLVPTPVVAPVEIQERQFGLFVLPRSWTPPWRAILKEGGRALLWPSPVTPPALSPGSSPLVVTTQRVGTDIWPALGDGLAQPLHLLLQGSHGC